MAKKRKKKYKLQKKDAEQKEFILKQKKEIKEIENKLIDLKSDASKQKRIKNFKISLNFLRLVGPYLISSAIIVAGINALGGGLPFVRDEMKHTNNIKKEFDSLGNIRIEEEYKEISSTDENFLYHYGVWNKNDDGSYTREIKKYSLKKITDEKINKIINGEVKAEDILDTKIYTTLRETKKNLTYDQISEKEFLQAVIFSEDKDDFIMVKETVGDNVFATICILILVFGIEVVIFFIRDEGSYDFQYEVEKIKDNYNKKMEDYETLINVLKIKKKNYDRLVK